VVTACKGIEPVVDTEMGTDGYTAATQAENEKPHYQEDSGVALNSLGWLMGLEPTTTGITILDSTN
jgi:hypothetical protein